MAFELVFSDNEKNVLNDLYAVFDEISEFGIDKSIISYRQT